jgi:hypothetical protein
MRTYEDIQIMVLRHDVPGLIKAAKDADETIREQAIKALRLIDSEEVAQVLLDALNDPSDKVRRAAQFACKPKPLGQPREGAPVVAIPVEIPQEFEQRKDLKRWLWIVLGSWGIAFLLLAGLVLFTMFSGGNFGNSGQILMVIVFALSGCILLYISVKRLKIR